MKARSARPRIEAMAERRMKVYFLIVASIPIWFSLSVTSWAKDLGVFGAVYDIAEKDALKEIEEKAKETDVNRFIDRQELVRKLKSYAPDDLRAVKDIPPARKDRTFLVDMKYTLGLDIADEKGTVIYPKGYAFNPLSYVTYPKTIVVLNGASPAQLAWFKNSGLNEDLGVKLLITDGSYAVLSKDLKRPVFYASKAVIDVFQIEATPSVVKQKGTIMEVREVPVSEKKGP